LKKTKLRFVVHKSQKLLAAPRGGCKKLRETRSGALKGSALARAWKYPGVLTGFHGYRLELELKDDEQPKVG